MEDADIAITALKLVICYAHLAYIFYLSKRIPFWSMHFTADMSSCFSDELTVWRNGLEQLLDNSLLLLDNEDDGSLNLRCLGTQGNYDLIWKTVGISELPQVISSTTPDVTISYVTNDANITLHDFRRFEGTLRCESQQSGLTISIHLTRGELVLCLVLSRQTF